MTERRKYDSTVARIAGNVASGIAPDMLRARMPTESMTDIYRQVAFISVAVAREIVTYVQQTEPAPPPDAKETPHDA